MNQMLLLLWEFQNYIGSIPIMVHSKRCVLHGMDSVKLSELGRRSL